MQLGVADVRRAVDEQGEHVGADCSGTEHVDRDPAVSEFGGQVQGVGSKAALLVM
jgi:hypothetical protein